MEGKSFATLRQFIGHLITSYQPVAVNQNSFFVNDVSDGISLEADTGILETLLGSLFYLVGRCSRESSLHVAAATYEDRVVLDIIDQNPTDYNILKKLDHLRMLAKKIGGFLDITGHGTRGTLISLNFMNSKKIAADNPLKSV